MKQLTDPEWITTWRTLRSDALDPIQVNGVISAVRQGATFEETLKRTGMDTKECLKVVAAVGSRCTQIGKHEFKIADIVSAGTGAAAGARQEGAGWVVAAAQGWLRTRRKGDVRRSYAALLVASDRIVADAIERTVSATDTPGEVRYGHYADLYNSARGILPPLHKVTANRPSVVPYLIAWDSIDAHAQQAVNATRVLLSRPPVEHIPALLRASYWLLPNTRTLHMTTQSLLTATSPTVRAQAGGRLGEQIRRLAELNTRQPQKLNPTRLEHLSATQFRAVAAQDGYLPGEGFGSRDDTSLARFAEQAKVAMAAL